MKNIRPEFTPEEYQQLRVEADRLNISLKRLVHDRAVGTNTCNHPLTEAQILVSEISKIRETLNQIIRRETTTEIRLYEDDLIRLEMAMTELEAIVAAYITQVLKEAT